MNQKKAQELRNWIDKSGFTKGNRQILVLGIQFSGSPAEAEISSVDSLMNIHTLGGGSGKGSFKDYFREVSYGQFIPESHVHGWYTANHSYEYYENEIGLSAARDSLFIEALSRANEEGIDFSPFDNDGDGEAEAVILLTSRSVGAQARFYVDETYQGINFKDFTIQPIGENVQDDLGTICHEYGHILGLPDLYKSDQPLGLYDLMSHAKTGIPGHLSAWSKAWVGWIDPELVEEEQLSTEIPNSVNSPFALKIFDNPYEDDTYFLVENRRKTGYDASSLPGEGLIVYHVDETYSNEHVRVLQADGMDDLGRFGSSNGTNGNVGDPGDFYPGSGDKRSITPNTDPNTLDFQGNDWGISITNISNSAETMNADIRPSRVPGYTLRYDDGIEGLFSSSTYNRFPFFTDSFADSIWAGARFYPNAGDSLRGVKTSFYPTYPDGISSVDLPRYHLRIYDHINPETNQPENLLYSQDGSLTLPTEGPGNWFIPLMPTIWLDRPVAMSDSVFVALCLVRNRNEPTVDNQIITDIQGTPSGNSYMAFGSDFPVFTNFEDHSNLEGEDVTLRLYVLDGDYTTSRPPVALEYPEDNSKNISTEVEFSWNSIQRAVEYRLQVSGDRNNFTDSSLYDVTLEETNFTVPEPLLYGTAYYWRVMGLDESGEGEWSDIWSFKTENISAPENLTLSVKDGTINLSWEMSESTSIVESFKIYKGASVGKLSVYDEIDTGINNYKDAQAAENTSFFTVTAVDNRGKESKFSNIVSFYSDEISLQESWILSSIPVASQNIQLESSKIFEFEGKYRSVSALEPGQGYWVKSDEGDSYDISDTGLNRSTLLLDEGWNLIGTLSDSLATEAIIDSTQILSSAPVFSYDGQAYQETNVLMPGRGYWIRATEPGKITLDLRSVIEPGKSKPDENSVSNQFDRLVISNGHTSQTLYLNGQLEEDLGRDQFLLPPAPLDPGLDVRFAGNYTLAETDSIAFELTSRSYPVSISYKPGSGSDTYFLEGMNGNNRRSIGQLKPDQSIRIYQPYPQVIAWSEANRMQDVPDAFDLKPNYPNPFNPVTTIRYDLPEQTKVSLEVYNLVGRRIAVLADELQPAGTHRIEFDASGFASGLYFIHMRAGTFAEVQKMVLMK